MHACVRAFASMGIYVSQCVCVYVCMYAQACAYAGVWVCGGGGVGEHSRLMCHSPEWYCWHTGWQKHTGWGGKGLCNVWYVYLYMCVCVCVCVRVRLCLCEHSRLMDHSPKCCCWLDGRGVQVGAVRVCVMCDVCMSVYAGGGVGAWGVEHSWLTCHSPEWYCRQTGWQWHTGWGGKGSCNAAR